MLPTGTKWNNVRGEAGVGHDHARGSPSTMDLASLQSRGVLHVFRPTREREGRRAGTTKPAPMSVFVGVFSSNYPTYP